MPDNFAALRAFGQRWLAPFAPRERDMPYLEPVTAVVRMLFGLLVLHRAVDNLGMTAIADSDPATACLLVVVSVGGLMLSIGLLTPVAIAGLLLYHAFWPVAPSLGMMVSVQLLWGLLLLDGGRRFSLDARLIRSGSAPWLAALYRLSAPTERIEIAKARFLMLGLFWGNCLTAMLFHLHDSFWLKGQVLQLALTAPYLSDHYARMSTIQRQFPTGFMVFCQVGMAVQALWELCLLPFMFNRWTRVFVVCQGLAFFSVSLVLMNLQYLPLVEMLMWLLIFGPAAAGWVAHRRPAPATPTAWRPSPPKPHFSGFVVPVLLIGGFAATTQVLLAGPLVPQHLFAKVRYVHEHMKPLFSAFGQARVEVFNKQDLEMASVHLVIQEVDAVGRHLRVVPLNDLEGGRLDYLRNNLTYFNHSLRWRRTPLERKFVDNDSARPSTVTKDYARAVAMLDASLTGLDGPRRYRANVYVRAMRLDLTPPRWTSARLTSSFPIELTTAELEAHRKTQLPRFNLPPGQAFSAERQRMTHDALTSMSAVGRVLDTP